MYIDKTTLSDLSVFNLQDDSSLFYLIDYTTTSEGKSELIKMLHHPLNKLDEILNVQEILKLISEKFDQWPDEISNGTLMVIEKFFNDNPDPIPEEISHVQANVYKWIHPRDHALILFSMKQLFLLIKGYQKIHDFFNPSQLPAPLAEIIAETKQILSNKNQINTKHKKKKNGRKNYRRTYFRPLSIQKISLQ